MWPFSGKKINMVVIKRTTDLEPYRILNLNSKDEKKEPEKREKFVSPLYGEVEESQELSRVSTVDPRNYVDFGRDGFTIEGMEEREPYKEFRKVKTTKKTEKKEETIATTHPTIFPELNKEGEKVVEEEKPISFYKYEEKESDEEIDRTLLSGLFEKEEEKVQKPSVKETPNRSEENMVQLFGENEFNKQEKIQKTETETDNEDGDQYSLYSTKEKMALLNEPKMNAYKNYRKPSMDLLDPPVEIVQADVQTINTNIDILNQTLASFRIDGQVKDYTQGPTFTRYALMLAPGVSGGKVEQISSDIMRSLSAKTIRIENPIPGQAYVGVEVPNIKRRTVKLRELIDTKYFMDSKDPLLVPVGLDVEGKAKYCSIADFPHGLVAGSSGSGKSVFITCMIASLLYKNTPNDLRLFFIDPKQVDLQQFKDVPHLISPIVSEVKDGINSFKWLLNEMERRFTVFRMIGGVTKLKEYNEYVSTSNDTRFKKLPYIVCVVEEAGDFMMNGGAEADELITRLVQKSRAAGIHIILAMQKPVAKVLSTTIKSNASARFALRVTSNMDSMTILDTAGAEKLLGWGDMMFYLSGDIGRYQSAFISPLETSQLNNYLKKQGEQDFLFDPQELDKKNREEGTGEVDELFADVARYVVYNERCSTNAITQEFGIGFNRANNIVKSLEQFGIVSENAGTKAREVLVTADEIDEILNKLGV